MNVAGVPHRVLDIDPAAADTPDIGTMSQFAARTYADPFFDSSATNEALAYWPTPRADALLQTVEWLRTTGKLQ